MEQKKKGPMEQKKKKYFPKDIKGILNPHESFYLLGHWIARIIEWQGTTLSEQFSNGPTILFWFSE